MPVYMHLDPDPFPLNASLYEFHSHINCLAPGLLTTVLGPEAANAVGLAGGELLIAGTATR